MTTTLKQTSKKLYFKIVSRQEVGIHGQRPDGTIVLTGSRVGFFGPQIASFEYTDYMIGSKAGEWLPPTEGNLRFCANGYHALRLKDISYWVSYLQERAPTSYRSASTPEVWLVELANARESKKNRKHKVISHDIRFVRRLDIKDMEQFAHLAGRYASAIFDIEDANHHKYYYSDETRERNVKNKELAQAELLAFLGLTTKEVYL